MKTLSIIIFAAILLSCPAAEAEYLSIAGSTSINVAISGNEAQVTGVHVIDNRGDGKALSVYPEVFLGGWRWSGQPCDIGPKARHEWRMEERLDVSLLGRSYASSEFSMPARGAIPVLTMQRYTDINKRNFTAVTFSEITAPHPSPSELAVLKTAPVRLQVEPLPGRQIRITVQNLAFEAFDGLLSLFTPDELELSFEPVRVQLEPKDTWTQMVSYQEPALPPQSRLPFLTVLEWNEQNLRNYTASAAAISGEQQGVQRIGLLHVLLLAVLTAGIYALLRAYALKDESRE